MNCAEDITIRAGQWSAPNSALSRQLVLNHQNSLRVIGRFLDQQQATAYGITESENGFIVNPLKHAGNLEGDTTFSECVLQELLRDAVLHRGSPPNAPASSLRLFGTTNEDLLRAVGHKLDGRRAQMVSVAVLPSRVVVCGTQPSTRRPTAEREAFELILDLPAVRLLLFEARTRRTNHQPVRVESAMSESERRLAHRMTPLAVDPESPNLFRN